MLGSGHFGGVMGETAEDSLVHSTMNMNITTPGVLDQLHFAIELVMDNT